MTSEVVAENVQVDKKIWVISRNEKYKAILTVCQRIAECVVDKGKRSFESWMGHLIKVVDTIDSVGEKPW
ncbi:hypothetical protein F441_17543 [Phytophthora nicotianae CJ01A1]|uniref:Uncharacterized protein n=4 Tax=Phytophthora nicotianae TaxID=4792 RepID=W2YHG1_PHYNI|nr:hypothetical protein L915_17203 [Phytophthora nicotianae]ETO64878.1 hypothetical protein F444_17709 [Phytophthora nicotianae P1976]ETP05974.1 hypothetical protein F441_17543 [Phytophthora nicotianae CJ01A1]ETP34088.1 hypothetical protein F442_17525 [Phytophthora nicotianae P10297]ETL29818.1 hypothetical protein L916_17098 [Phytophthora nicotianae]